jgi:hypothetical protein
MMLGAEAAGNGARILRLIELFFFGLSENQRESICAHAVVAHHSDQCAGVDSTGKKHADGNVAHQVRQHGIAQDRGKLYPCAIFL